MATDCALIAELLPSAVASADAFGDTLGALLFPQEEAAIARAVPQRQREFATGRACARAALARLGVEPVAIVPGDRGAPAWPAGIVGSITHCDGYRAAVAAHAQDVLALGVDAEPDKPLPDGVLALVALAQERNALARLAIEHPGVCWDRLLFSAKESLYKAWFPLQRRWLGFKQAVVDFDPGARKFQARLHDGSGFAGRWLARDGLLLTAITMPRLASGVSVRPPSGMNPSDVPDPRPAPCPSSSGPPQPAPAETARPPRPDGPRFGLSTYLPPGTSVP